MPIPTEPIGSIPRPPDLVAGLQQFAAGHGSRDQLPPLQDPATPDPTPPLLAAEAPVIPAARSGRSGGAGAWDGHMG